MRGYYVCRCRALRLLLLLCLYLLLSLDGALEVVSLSVAVVGGRERDDGGDVDNAEDDDEAGQSRLRWEMPRAIVTDSLSLDPHEALVPLCPLLDGSWRAWLLRQYADGSSEQPHVASVNVAMKAIHCMAHYDEHKHKTKTTSESVCVLSCSRSCSRTDASSFGRLTQEYRLVSSSRRGVHTRIRLVARRCEPGVLRSERERPDVERDTRCTPRPLL